MKVLIGIDDSSYSRAAVEWVAGMTWPEDTRFFVLSVAEAPILAMAEYAGASIDPQALEEGLREHQEWVARAENTLAQAGLRVSGRVEPGNPHETILRIARESGVDLVVVGSHGRTGLTKLVMGSVAGHVSTHAPCSVLVVRRRPGVK